jgi:hypothetical protein
MNLACARSPETKNFVRFAGAIYFETRHWAICASKRRRRAPAPQWSREPAPPACASAASVRQRRRRRWQHVVCANAAPPLRTASKRRQAHRLCGSRVGGEWRMKEALGSGPSEDTSLLQALEASMLRQQAVLAKVLANQHELVKANQEAEHRHHHHLIDVYHTLLAQKHCCGASEPAPGTVDRSLQHSLVELSAVERAPSRPGQARPWCVTLAPCAHAQLFLRRECVPLAPPPRTAILLQSSERHAVAHAQRPGRAASGSWCRWPGLAFAAGTPVSPHKPWRRGWRNGRRWCRR